MQTLDCLWATIRQEVTRLIADEEQQLASIRERLTWLTGSMHHEWNCAMPQVDAHDRTVQAPGLQDDTGINDNCNSGPCYAGSKQKTTSVPLTSHVATSNVDSMVPSAQLNNVSRQMTVSIHALGSIAGSTTFLGTSGGTTSSSSSVDTSTTTFADLMSRATPCQDEDPHALRRHRNVDGMADAMIEQNNSSEIFKPFDHRPPDEQLVRYRELRVPTGGIQQSLVESRGIECCSASNTIRLRRVRQPSLPAETLQEHNPKHRVTKLSGEPKSKRIKSARSPEKRTQYLLQEMSRIDQNVSDPKAIHQHFLDRCPNVDEDIANSLVRLFYSIASPQALEHLREACMLARVEGEITIPQKTDAAAQTINALNALNTATMVHSILRRFHLVRLHEHRAAYEMQYQTSKPAIRRTRRVGCAKAQKSAASLAMADLMTEAYPHLVNPHRIRDAHGTEYGKRYSTLKYMLAAGRNWSLLQQTFSAGILALVPTGGEAGMQNSEYVCPE